MARNTLTATALALAGINPSLASANADGSQVKVSDREDVFIVVTNGGGGEIDVTVLAQKDVHAPGLGLVDVADKVVAIPASGTRWIGPFPPAYVNDDGFVQWNYEGVSSVTAAAFRCGKVS